MPENEDKNVEKGEIDEKDRNSSNFVDEKIVIPIKKSLVTKIRETLAKDLEVNDDFTEISVGSASKI